MFSKDIAGFSENKLGIGISRKASQLCSELRCPGRCGVSSRALVAGRRGGVVVVVVITELLVGWRFGF